MKIRFFQVVWVISVLWLSLVVYGGIKKDDLFIMVIALGWPALLGLLASFITTGTFLLPRQKGETK